MENEFGLSSLLLLDIKGNVNQDKITEFPFKNALSFRLLIEHIKNASLSENKARSALAKAVLEELEKAPGLLKPIYDPSEVDHYKSIIKDMLMFIFPDAFWEKQTYAISYPFDMEISFGSPRFNELIKLTGTNVTGQMNLDAASFSFGKAIGGFAAILRKVYGVNLKFEFPIIYKIPEPVTGLDRYFKLNLADEFTEVITKGKIRQFDEAEIKVITRKLYDIEYMKTILPPENFEFHGFMVINAINITDTEILSSMKRDLIEKDAIISYSGFLKLQHSMRSLMRCPELLLGLVDCDCGAGDLIEINNNIGNSFLMDDKIEINEATLKNSIYEYSFEEKKVVIIEDLEDYPNRTILEDKILAKGIRNVLVTPLLHGNEIVGMMELGSPNPGQINMVNTLKLREVLPLFAMAVSRSRTETNNKIQAIIKEKCTAIHPTLEWRFRKAALKLLKIEEQGGQGEMDEIVFHNVYPLYGLSDI
ncbi:MAG: GAF domain-containing protein, partial [Ignavibacteria bacterium]